MNFARTYVLLALFILVAPACGGGKGPAESTNDSAAAMETTELSGGLSGSVNISGSSTVEPISALNAEKFRNANTGVAMSVDGPGTGDGFQLFCAGDTDISNASRAIKQPEMETCAANGIEWIELNIAIDGLSVVTSLNNPLSCLATSDLYALLGEESIGFDKWSDANEIAVELRAPNAPYPDSPLEITAPGEESGTFDSFVEFLIDGKAGGEDYSDTRDVESVRPDYTASANDNTIIEGIRGTDTSLGWVGYAFYVNNQERVKALGVDVGDGCVEPSAATISDGSYAFSRPLYIYVNATAAASKPELASFVDFYLSAEGLASVSERGYIELDNYDSVIERWSTRTTGRV